MTPKQTWKRLHLLTTTPIGWNNYVEAVLHYTQEPGEQHAKPKRKRRRKNRSNLDKQPGP